MVSRMDNVAWVVPSSASAVTHLEQRSLPVPTAGPQQALIRMTAASLNYRDLLVGTHSPDYPGINGLPGNHAADIVPCSDGAGVIHTAGPSSRWAGREGTTVVLHPNQWLSGDVRNLDLTKVFGACDSEGECSIVRLPTTGSNANRCSATVDRGLR